MLSFSKATLIPNLLKATLNSKPKWSWAIFFILFYFFMFIPRMFCRPSTVTCLYILSVWSGNQVGVCSSSEICPGRYVTWEWLQTSAHYCLFYPKWGTQEDSREDSAHTVCWQKPSFWWQVGLTLHPATVLYKTFLAFTAFCYLPLIILYLSSDPRRTTLVW